jgi:hypothetical protein
LCAAAGAAGLAGEAHGLIVGAGGGGGLTKRWTGGVGQRLGVGL